MSPLETFKVNGYTVEIHLDEDCSSPREMGAGNFLFLGFPHRGYNIGDETFNPDVAVDVCEACDGAGYLNDDPEDRTECSKCEGEGEIRPKGLAGLIEWVKRKYKATLVLPVGMIDHSGVSYYIGGGAHPHDPGGWDSGTCGLILDTPEVLAERGQWGDNDDPIDWLTAGMKAEIEEYSAWASGECYGYVIKDRNGDETDGSCWGFIGSEYVRQEARSVAASLPPVDELISVRLTRLTWESILHLLDERATDIEISGAEEAAGDTIRAALEAE